MRQAEHCFQDITQQSRLQMPSLKQAQTANRHGCLPPLGCTLPSDSRLPQVATGNEGKSSYEAAFLIDTDMLYGTFTATIAMFPTLTAWFAYNIRAQAIKDGLLKQNALLDLQRKLPAWQTVWDLIQEKGTVWTDQHKKRGPKTKPWDIQSPMSALDLFAHVLVVLALHITTNTSSKPSRNHVTGLHGTSTTTNMRGGISCSTASWLTSKLSRLQVLVCPSTGPAIRAIGIRGYNLVAIRFIRLPKAS